MIAFLDTSFIVNEPPPIANLSFDIPDFNGFNVSCNGYDDGYIDLTVDGTGEYTFLWNEIYETEDITNLNAGYYQLTVTNTNSCYLDTFVYLNEPTPFQTSYELSNYNGYNISCFGYFDGWIEQITVGSVPPYIYIGPMEQHLKI